MDVKNSGFPFFKGVGLLQMFYEWMYLLLMPGGAQQKKRNVEFISEENATISL